MGKTATTRVTMNYMASFECVGSACEDNCCHGWSIAIDRVSLNRLDRSLRAAGGPPTTHFVEPNPTPTDSAAGWLRLDHALRCRFQRDDHLCQLQSGDIPTAGSGSPDEGPHLPATCATYPRSWRRAGDIFELGGAVSCPEVARRLLLDPDALALRMDSGDGRPIRELHGLIYADEHRPWVRYLGDIRLLMARLFDTPAYDWETRVFQALFAARRLDAVLSPETPVNAAGAYPEIDETLAQLERPALMNLVAERSRTIETPAALVLNLAGQILHQAAQPAHRAEFRALVQGALASWGDGDATPTLESVWTRYRDRSARLWSLQPERLTRYFHHFATQYWVQNWYVESPSLVGHLRGMLVQNALQKLLLFGHPLVSAALAQEDASQQDTRLGDALDAAAVEVFYLVARTIEHTGLLVDIQAILDRVGASDAALCTYLLRF